MRFAQLPIAVAAAALSGLAAWVGARHGVALIELQTHLNLVGWMSMGLYGLYYCSPGPVVRPRLAWSQAAAATLGFVAMSGGLAALGATGDRRLGAIVAAGALFAVVGMVLFLVQVLTARRTAPAYA
jgi:hypothetical protein